MASKAYIANLALADLGANEISDPDNEDTKEANLVNTFWDAVVDEVFEAHCWDFATVFVSLAEDAAYTMVDEKYDYAYNLPADYIRPVDEESETNWERREQHILSDESPFVLEYIKQITDVSKYPPHFYKAVASLLRARMSIPLKKKGAKDVNWLGIYEERDLPDARLVDARQSRRTLEKKTKHTKDNDSWVGCFD